MTSAVAQSRVRRLEALLSEELGTRSGDFGTPRARWRGNTVRERGESGVAKEERGRK